MDFCLWIVLYTGINESTTGSELWTFASGLPCIPVLMNPLLVVNYEILPLDYELPVVLKATTSSHLLEFPVLTVRFHIFTPGLSLSFVFNIVS